MIVDTHCHLDDSRYEEDLDEVIARSLAQGVEKIIIPAADPDTLHKAVKIAETYPFVYFSVGVHPYDAHRYDETFLESYVAHPKCVAIGECGLDYYRLSDDEGEKQRDIETQKKVFIAQIALAKKYQKPLIVHIRDASCDSKEILVDHKAREVGGVLHCFNADEQLLSLANEGFYFGIGGVLTFSNAKKLVNVLPKIPLEKLVLETDAPYLTPHPHRGTRNEPAYTSLVADKVSLLLDIDISEIKRITSANSFKLFNLF